MKSMNPSFISPSRDKQPTAITLNSKQAIQVPKVVCHCLQICSGNSYDNTGVKLCQLWPFYWKTFVTL